MAAVESDIEPTAKHTLVVGQSIPPSEKVVPTVFSVQLAPPSVVLRIDAPTVRKQVETLGQLMSESPPVGASYRFSQDLPPSVVPKMAAGYGPPFRA
jgi:hypothetical protein